jgi:hypothetical protein
MERRGYPVLRCLSPRICGVGAVLRLEIGDVVETFPTRDRFPVASEQARVAGGGVLDAEGLRDFGEVLGFDGAIAKLPAQTGEDQEEMGEFYFRSDEML